MNNNSNLSKGGLIGALVGTLASTKTYKDSDKTIHKVAKTGLLASVGYILGMFIEKLFRKK